MSENSRSTSTVSDEHPVLILPGFGGSGPDHWQSIWEQRNPSYVRVEQRDWDTPDLVEWMDSLARSVDACGARPVLVAHSLACSLVAHFAASHPDAVAAALLVSPADVDEICEFYEELASFAPMPLAPLPFPSTVVASNDDLYILEKRAELFAAAWGSELVMLDGAGHINGESNLGAWDDGAEILARLTARTTS